jgi:hypothetical protein
MADERGPTAEEAGIDPEDTGAEGPGDPDSGAETRKKTVEKGNALADTLLGKKLNAINSRIDRDKANGIEKPEISDNEGKLLLAHRLISKGWEPTLYTQDHEGNPRPDGIPLGEGLTVKTPDGREIVITHLSSQRPPPDELKEGDTIYYTYKDPANPGDAPEISGDDLAAAQLKAEADAIGSLFSDPNEATLVAWRAKGEDNPPPLDEDTLKTVEDKLKSDEAREADPTYQAKKAINESADRIQLQINDMQARGEKIPFELTQLLSQLRVAQKVTGENYSQLAVFGAIQGLIFRDDQTDLTSVRDQLMPGIEQAVDNLRTKFINAGFTTNEIDQIHKEGLGALAENPGLVGKFAEIEGLEEEMFGRKVSEEELRDMFDAQVPEELKRKLIDAGVWTGKKAGWIALILLAIPAAAAYAAANMTAASMSPRR